jgi:hypothetical protein
MQFWGRLTGHGARKTNTIFEKTSGDVGFGMKKFAH